MFKLFCKNYFLAVEVKTSLKKISQFSGFFQFCGFCNVLLNFLPAIIGPLNLLESIALVKSKMYLKHLMSSVLKIFCHLLSVSAFSIPQEHKKMKSGLSMEYDEVSMLHPPTKNKGRHNFKYLEFSY